MYTTSDGRKIPYSELNIEHLLNSLAKKQREIFKSQTLEEYNSTYNTIAELYEEYIRRLGNFIDNKLDKEWK